MYYADTSVLVSYVFASDVGHKASREKLDNIFSKREKVYASSFTLVETCNTICRKIIREENYELIEPLNMYINMYKEPEKKCRFLLSMIISFLEDKGVVFVDNESLYEFTSLELNKFKIPGLLKKSIELSYRINIRIKDLIHIVYASMLSNICNLCIKYFLTRDIEDFERVADEVKRLLKIDIVLIK